MAARIASNRRPLQHEYDEDIDDNGDDQHDVDDDAAAVVPPPLPAVDDEEKKEPRVRKVWRGSKEWFLKPFVQVVIIGTTLSYHIDDDSITVCII